MKMILLTLVGTLMLGCSMGYSQTCPNCGNAAGPGRITGVTDAELFGAVAGDTLADGSIVVSVTETTTSSVGVSRRPVRRLGSGVAQVARRGIARRSNRRANRLSNRANRACATAGRVSAKFNSVAGHH